MAETFQKGDIVFSAGVGLEGQILAVRAGEFPYQVWWSDEDVSWEAGENLTLEGRP